MDARFLRAGEATQRRIPPSGVGLPNSKRRDSLRCSRPTWMHDSVGREKPRSGASRRVASISQIQNGGIRFATPALQRDEIRASIHPRPHSWRYVLFHGRLAGKKTSVADRTHRCFARSIRIRTGTTPLHDRRSGDSSRSFALHLDIAGWRCGFFVPLARHQIEIFPFLAKSGAAFNTPRCKRRTRDLAATLLGTRHTRRRRLHATHGLHPLQPRQTWPCATRLRLAIFDIPSSRSTRNVCAGLGRRRRRARDGSGVTMRRDALRSSRPTKLYRAGAAAQRRIPPNGNARKFVISIGGIRCASPALHAAWL